MIIVGWKSIAATLHVSVRTAQRMHLPVVALHPRSVATTAEAIERWRADRDATLAQRCRDAMLAGEGRGVAEVGR